MKELMGDGDDRSYESVKVAPFDPLKQPFDEWFYGDLYLTTWWERRTPGYTTS